MASGNQGGSHEQHVEAGKQSHKNTGSGSDSPDSGVKHEGEVKDPKTDGRLKANR